MNPRIRIAALAPVAASALLLAGCATAGSGENDSESEPQEVSTEITDEDVNLVLAYVDDPPTPALVEEFEEEYPNVTIDAQQTDFGNYITSITRSMSSDDAPDLAQYNPGAMRSLIPAGEVLDLSAYYDAYGWDEAFPQASLDQLMSDDEAMQFATGSLYAAPGALSVLGVFYNKDILADAGIDAPPQSLAEFEEALAAVQDNGDQPMSVGGLEVGGFQLWNLLLNSTGETQEYLDWVYGAPDSTIETDAAEQAAQTISDWVDEGYISPSANATADSDALAEFTSGEAAFLVTGNWSAAAIDDELGDAGGFFILPREAADEPPVASGSSVAYSISARTEHPDVAAAFLDYMSSAEAGQIAIDTGFMPVDTEAGAAAEGTLGEVAEAFAPVAENDNIVPFPDFAAPGMIDQLKAGIQGIVSDQMEPDQFLASMQETWTSYHG
ncbi:ABC transporter substrate-binding protein [Ruania albidiflava]|uniref:ABC transporter substrate-binding protein n=1 Tax=Ruania albidiflava TaxID=366586 RepID=UPI0023F081B0|nr:extracellular solute-binding protein [Ruania albidiflava]